MSTQEFKRKLSAIFSVDVAGYSRLMGEDEAATVRTLEAYKEIMFSLIKQHRGWVIDSPGDNLLAEFASVVDAVQCAVAVQKELQARNADLPETPRMRFRIGINLGDVIEEGDRIYGYGVNIAARLESCADPGGICVSKTAFDHIESKLPLGYEFLGEQQVKNIAKPVGAYCVLMDPRVPVAGAKEKKPSIPLWRKKSALAGAEAVLIVILGVGVWNFYFRAPAIEPASKGKMAFPLPDKPSIAVLPFVNISGDPAQEYISDGICESIITALCKIPEMFVIARTSTSAYKGKSVTIKKVIEELGVRYVKGEIRDLVWSKVDMKERVIRLEAADTKEKKAKTIPIGTEFYKMLKALPVYLHKPNVFMYNGRPIKRNFSTGLKTACKEAGILWGREETGGFVFDDIRDGFVTDCREAGVSKPVRMSIPGHSPKDMDDRYNTVKVEHQHEAIKKLEGYRAKELEKYRTLTKSLTKGVV